MEPLTGNCDVATVCRHCVDSPPAESQLRRRGREAHVQVSVQPLGNSRRHQGTQGTQGTLGDTGKTSKDCRTLRLSWGRVGREARAVRGYS